MHTGRSSTGLQQRCQFFLKRVFVYHPDMRRNDLALAVDQKRDRHIPDVVKFPNSLVADHHRVLHSLLFQERLHQLPAALVHRNANDCESPLLVLFLKLDVPGNFLFAASTPCSPEVEQDHFAFLSRQGERSAFGVGEREVGSDSILRGQQGNHEQTEY